MAEMPADVCVGVAFVDVTIPGGGRAGRSGAGGRFTAAPQSGPPHDLEDRRPAVTLPLVHVLSRTPSRTTPTGALVIPPPARIAFHIFHPLG